MAIAVKSLSTAGVPAQLRVEYWSRALNELFGQVSVDSFGAETIDCQIDHLQLSRLRLCTIKGTRTRIAMPVTSQVMTSNSAVRVLFQTQGVSRFEQDGRALEFGPGDCIAYDFSRPHRFTNLELTRLHAVMIPKCLLHQGGLKLQGMSAQKVSVDATAQIVRNFLESLLQGGADLPAQDAATMAHALLDLLVLIVARLKDSVPAISRAELLRIRAKGFIAKNLTDPGLSISDISSALGCTKRYLHLVFRDEGTTVARYIWRSRIERSRGDLEAATDCGKSITEVALSWGFSSPAHFSRMFKERFGFAPSLLRRGKAPALRNS